MKNRLERLGLGKIKIATLSTVNSLLGGDPTDPSTATRTTSIEGTIPTAPPTILSTNPNCN